MTTAPTALTAPTAPTVSGALPSRLMGRCRCTPPA